VLESPSNAHSTWPAKGQPASKSLESVDFRESVDFTDQAAGEGWFQVV